MFNRSARGLVVLLRALVGRLWNALANCPRSAFCSPTCIEPLETRQFLSVAPTQVPILTASAVAPTQVRLSWVARAAEEIVISKRTSTNKSWGAVKTLAGTKQRYTVSGLRPNKSYTFRVRALQKDGHWSLSKSVIVTTPRVSSAPLPGDDVTYSGPITITAGGTYTGNWQSLDPDVPAVRIRTSQPVFIENSTIRSRGTLIDAYGFAADITIRNSRGFGMNPNARGEHAGRFLDVDGFANVDVENNYMEGTAGIYLYDYRGDHSNSQTVKVLRNQAKNIDGRTSDGAGGYYFDPEEEYVQFFQIDGVRGIRNAEVAWNQVINEPGKSLVEDNINIYKSSGTADDPFRIHDNYIDGGYPFDPVNDTDYSGGGILLSDQGSSFISAFRNQVLNTTNYGVAISSGHDNVFYDNRIFSTGILPNGRPIPTQNVGAYIWNINEESSFARNWGHDNLIGWVNNDGRNDWWVPDSSSWDNNTSLNGGVTSATIRGEWAIWQSKLANAGVVAGVQQVGG
jgi:Fibronectin type III domain